MKFVERMSSLLKVFVCTFLMLSSFGLYAQVAEVTVSGTIVDSGGLPVIGAAIIDSSDPSNGSISDADGNFAMTVKPGAELKVSCIGYRDYTLAVSGSQDRYRIVLEDDTLMLEETVVVGYGVQKKVTVTGAVAAVKNSEIVTTKNENLQNMLTGKVAGLRVLQNTAEPGQFNNSIDIRGFGAPLVVIDGVPRDNMARVDPEDVESISVLKDASAAIYGVRAANGVILITTKKGGKGKATISYSGNMIWQIPSNVPETVDAVDWMTLRNEAARHNVDSYNPSLPHSMEEIDEYRRGGESKYRLV